MEFGKSNENRKLTLFYMSIKNKFLGILRSTCFLEIFIPLFLEFCNPIAHQIFNATLCNCSWNSLPPKNMRVKRCHALLYVLGEETSAALHYFLFLRALEIPAFSEIIHIGDKVHIIHRDRQAFTRYPIYHR